MELKEQLQDRNLKWNWDTIADHVIRKPDLMEELIRFSFEGEVIEQQNAAAVLSKICDRKKSLLTPYLVKLFKHLEKHPIDAVKRSTMRTFQFAPIPEEIEGELFDKAVQYLRSMNEPIAIKAFSLTCARRICEKYPELANELIPLVELVLEEKISSGMTNRAGHELIKLRKIAQK